MGKKWKELSEAERTPYIEEAERLRILHLREYPGYKYRPKKRLRPGEEANSRKGEAKDRRIVTINRRIKNGEDSLDTEEDEAMSAAEAASPQASQIVPSPLSSPVQQPSPYTTTSFFTGQMAAFSSPDYLPYSSPAHLDTCAGSLCYSPQPCYADSPLGYGRFSPNGQLGTHTEDPGSPSPSTWQYKVSQLCSNSI